MIAFTKNATDIFGSHLKKSEKFRCQLVSPSPPLLSMELGQKQEYTVLFVNLPGNQRSLDGIVLPVIKLCHTILPEADKWPSPTHRSLQPPQRQACLGEAPSAVWLWEPRNVGWPLPPPGSAPAEVFQVSSISENQRKIDLKFQTELLSSHPKVLAKGLTG